MSLKFSKHKRIFSLSCCLLIFCLTNLAYGAHDTKLDIQKNQIEVQRGHAKKEIHKLKLLEKIETNRLYKNQQKLEYTQHSLETNQKKYVGAQNEVKSLERKLDTLLVQHKKHLNYTSKRIVQIYKHKRNNYVDFLLSSNDINSFLDRLYFENIIISYDKKKLQETKVVAREILILKDKIERQKKTLEASIATINREQETIQDAISKNEKLIEMFTLKKSFKNNNYKNDKKYLL